MKKLFALMLCLGLTLSVVACNKGTIPSDSTEEPATEASTTTPSTTTPTSEEASVEEAAFSFEYVTLDAEGMSCPVEPTEDMLFVQSLLNGLPTDILPEHFTIAELPADFIEYDAFTPYIEGMTAIRCESTIHTHLPFSVVVLNVPEGADVEAIRADIEANANPRKWICVEAEKVSVVANGNTILLVMSAQAFADTIVENFNNMMPN